MEVGTGRSGRWLDIAPERLAGWLESFSDRHGEAVAQTGGPPVDHRLPADDGPPRAGAGSPQAGAASRQAGAASRQAGAAAQQADIGSGQAGSGTAVVTFVAADGTIAQCHVPFPPIPADHGTPDAQRIAAHACAERTVGVLLVRLGGYAAGVFTGPQPQLAASKVGSRLVHGRSAAGGTSQQRFARRREKQASEALGAAADTAAAVFGPYAGKLDAVVLGGDRRAISGLRDDPRLRPYFDLAVDRFLTVPDPRLVVLKGTPRLFRAVRIRLTEPPG